MRWIKNSNGNCDAMLTFATMSFVICAFAILAPVLNGFHIPFSNYSLSFGTPDTTLVLAFLGATFTSYVVRRNKKDDIEAEEFVTQIK